VADNREPLEVISRTSPKLPPATTSGVLLVHFPSESDRSLMGTGSETNRRTNPKLAPPLSTILDGD
jgi:hypothetical protein